jgi:NAD-dependent dihydropyrimidine dehydrogenase PreA subunit
MIEVIDEQRCTGCNICVQACPTTVFDLGERIPVIARIEDCQTCFMCEAWCPEDALYVSPQSERLENPNLEELHAARLVGSYRAAIGWSRPVEVSSA